MQLSACCVIFLNEINFISFRYCYFMLVDIARVFLKSSDPDKNYINASFVDVSKKKNISISTVWIFCAE